MSEPTFGDRLLAKQPKRQPTSAKTFAKAAAAAMALFGFVYGYVGTAGAPFCGSMGQCLELAFDRGLAGFAPASLIPGAISAVIFAALFYILFLVAYGIRTAFRRQPSAGDGQARLTGPTPAVRHGPEQRTGPTHLPVDIRHLALAIALATGLFVALDGLEVWPSVPASEPTYACEHNPFQPEWDYVLDEATQLCEPTPFIEAEIRKQYGTEPLRHIKPVVDPLSVMLAHPATEGGWSYDPEYLVRGVMAAVVAFVGLAALRVAWRSLR